MDLQKVFVGLLALFALTEASSFGLLPDYDYPEADLASNSLGEVRSSSSHGRALVPGVGDMMSMASGGLESMVNMMLKMIDMSMVTNVIQKISGVVKMALDSGLQKLDAKMDKELGIKEFSTGTITLAQEAEVPQYIIDALMGMTSIASQALLFAE